MARGAQKKQDKRAKKEAKVLADFKAENVAAATISPELLAAQAQDVQAPIAKKKKKKAPKAPIDIIEEVNSDTDAQSITSDTSSDTRSIQSISLAQPEAKEPKKKWFGNRKKKKALKQQERKEEIDEKNQLVLATIKKSLDTLKKEIVKLEQQFSGVTAQLEIEELTLQLAEKKLEKLQFERQEAVLENRVSDVARIAEQIALAEESISNQNHDANIAPVQQPAAKSAKTNKKAPAIVATLAEEEKALADAWNEIAITKNQVKSIVKQHDKKTIEIKSLELMQEALDYHQSKIEYEQLLLKQRVAEQSKNETYIDAIVTKKSSLNIQRENLDKEDDLKPFLDSKKDTLTRVNQIKRAVESNETVQLEDLNSAIDEVVNKQSFSDGSLTAVDEAILNIAQYHVVDLNQTVSQLGDSRLPLELKLLDSEKGNLEKLRALSEKVELYRDGCLSNIASKQAALKGALSTMQLTAANLSKNSTNATTPRTERVKAFQLAVADYKRTKVDLITAKKIQAETEVRLSEINAALVEADKKTKVEVHQYADGLYNTLTSLTHNLASYTDKREKELTSSTYGVFHSRSLTKKKIDATKKFEVKLTNALNAYVNLKQYLNDETKHVTPDTLKVVFDKFCEIKADLKALERENKQFAKAHSTRFFRPNRSAGQLGKHIDFALKQLDKVYENNKSLLDAGKKANQQYHRTNRNR